MGRDDELHDLERRQYGGDGPGLTAAELARLAALQRASTPPPAEESAAQPVAVGTASADARGERTADAEPPIPPSPRRRGLSLPPASTRNALLTILIAVLIVVGAFFAGRTSSGSERVAAGVPPIAAKTASALSWDDGSIRFVADVNANTVFSGTSDGGASRCVAVVASQTRLTRLHLCAPAAAGFRLAGGVGLPEDRTLDSTVTVDWDGNGVPTITPPGGLGTEASTSKNTSATKRGGALTQEVVHETFAREMNDGASEVRWLGAMGPYELWHARSSTERCVAAFLSADAPEARGLSGDDRTRVVCDVPDADRFVLDFPAVSASRTTKGFPTRLIVGLTNTGDITIRARRPS